MNLSPIYVKELLRKISALEIKVKKLKIENEKLRNDLNPHSHSCETLPTGQLSFDF